MKKMDSYGLKLCQFQAQIFQESIEEAECSSMIFIRRFMLSDLAKRMDKEGFLFLAVDVKDALTEIEVEYGPSAYGKEKFGNEEIYWTGYIYRYWAYITGLSSKQIYKIVKPDELRELYFPYHSLDPEQAIERIKEAKGMTEEDQIKKGVEILRRVRARRAGDGNK
ncbi:MAG: antitoxin [Lachnospiraceae bacterium]|nr:antitoxin [Lachnospiraceae bacterium]